MLEAPLLLEGGWDALVDEVWVTIAPEPVVLRRLKERAGLSEAQSLARIRSQLSPEEREKHADVIIDTDCSLDELKAKDHDVQMGVDLVRRAIEEPTRQIAGNAGKEGSIVVERIREKKDLNFGYNAQTDKYEDLVKAGVIDPTKVTRTALQNAASIAALLLTTEAVVVEKKEKEEKLPTPGPDMGGMY